MPRTAATNRTAASNRLKVLDIKSSLSFNGTSTYMTLPVVPDVTGFCFSIWFTYGAISSKTLIGWSNNATPSQGFRLVAENTTDNVYVAVSHSGGTKYVNAGSKKLRNKWVNVVFTHVQGAQKIYVNGVLTDSDTGTMIDAAGQTLTIGRNSWTATEFYAGSMSQLVFQNTTTPWTQAQITALYQSGTIPSGATAIYKLGEGAGTTVYDSSGNGNNGTITAGTYTSDVPTKKRGVVGGNLVYNGDFEYAPPFTAATTTNQRWVDGTAAGSTTNKLFGWAAQSITGSGSMQYDSTEKHSGTNSIKLSTAATGSRVDLHQMSTVSAATVLQHGIPALPSTAYTCTYWMKTNYVSGASANGARVRVFEKTGDGATQVALNVGTDISATTDWTQYTISFTTGATTRWMHINPCIVGNTGTATLIMDAWFDDIVLKPTTPTTRGVVS